MLIQNQQFKIKAYKNLAALKLLYMSASFLHFEICVFATMFVQDPVLKTNMALCSSDSFMQNDEMITKN